VSSYYLSLILFSLAAMAADAAIGHRKGHLGAGIVFTVFLGWLSLLILSFLPKTEERMIFEARQRGAS
jgi:hypothetical protein